MCSHDVKFRVSFTVMEWSPSSVFSFWKDKNNYFNLFLFANRSTGLCLLASHIFRECHKNPSCKNVKRLFHVKMNFLINAMHSVLVIQCFCHYDIHTVKNTVSFSAAFLYDFTTFSFCWHSLLWANVLMFVIVLVWKISSFVIGCQKVVENSFDRKRSGSTIGYLHSWFPICIKQISSSTENKPGHIPRCGYWH